MKQFYTPEQVADMLQINFLTVLKYIRQWKISVIKLGRMYRISEESFNDFIASCQK